METFYYYGKSKNLFIIKENNVLLTCENKERHFFDFNEYYEINTRTNLLYTIHYKNNFFSFFRDTKYLILTKNQNKTVATFKGILKKKIELTVEGNHYVLYLHKKRYYSVFLNEIQIGQVSNLPDTKYVKIELINGSYLPLVACLICIANWAYLVHGDIDIGKMKGSILEYFKPNLNWGKS